jgi:hypothetical protein
MSQKNPNPWKLVNKPDRQHESGSTSQQLTATKTTTIVSGYQTIWTQKASRTWSHNSFEWVNNIMYQKLKTRAKYRTKSPTREGSNYGDQAHTNHHRWAINWTKSPHLKEPRTKDRQVATTALETSSGGIRKNNLGGP